MSSFVLPAVLDTDIDTDIDIIVFLPLIYSQCHHQVELLLQGGKFKSYRECA